MYNVNWTLFITQQIWPDRHYQNYLDWVTTLISPLVSLHQLFLVFKTETDTTALYTGQVIYLEKRLNDVFDNALRRIYIDNSVDDINSYLFNRSETNTSYYLYNIWQPSTTYTTGQYTHLDDVYVSLTNNIAEYPPASSADWQLSAPPNYLFNNAELSAINDFTVIVPSALTFVPASMQALVNTYKQGGKQYNIVTI
jgi:hypothetical protein